jgi:hypothetical protein
MPFSDIDLLLFKQLSLSQHRTMTLLIPNHTTLQDSYILSISSDRLTKVSSLSGIRLEPIARLRTSPLFKNN